MSATVGCAQLSAEGIIETVAGSDPFHEDGVPAIAAQLNSPQGVAVDGAGNLFIADTSNHRIRKVDPAGVISTVAGDRTRGFGGDGAPAIAAQLNSPQGVAVDGAGNLFIADTSNHRIRKVDAAGLISTVAGDGTWGFSGDGGAATTAQLRHPSGVAVDGAGNLLIADTNNYRIRKVDAAGLISTVAGGGMRVPIGDGGPATAARLFRPSGVAMDGAGNLFIADTFNHRIRKVDAAGLISTVAGGSRGDSIGDGGPATAARLSYPSGVAMDGAGNLFIADEFNHRIRKVDAAGIISTVAGGSRGDSIGDGGPATAARLSSPSGVAVDGAGNLFIADTSNHRIRKVTLLPERAPLISSGGIVLANGTPIVNRISANAIVSVYGQGFAPQETQASSPGLDASGKIATNLADTCLKIDGKRVPLFLVFPTQVNAQVPHDLAPGQSQVQVIRGCGAGEEQRSPAATVTTAAVSPAFFNFRNNPDGINPVAAQHGGDPELVGAPGSIPGLALTPAEPGEYVTLFGTGFGATEPPLATGQRGVAGLASEISFAFGGIAVPPEDVYYAGASPCCAGLYQFTVRVPSDTPDGDAPVIATVQDVSTPDGPFLTVRRRQ